MRHSLSLPLGALLLAVGPAATSAQQGGTLSERYDFEDGSGHFDLPGRLEEISGLAITPEGRLFGHDDERAVVHEIDAEGGEVGKRFTVGDPPLAGDFEGMAIGPRLADGDRSLLLLSDNGGGSWQSIYALRLRGLPDR